MPDRSAVIPAQAGTQKPRCNWAPAFAGVPDEFVLTPVINPC